METRHINRYYLPADVRSRDTGVVQNAHRDVALDEARCEGFSESDPIAESVPSSDATTQNKVSKVSDISDRNLPVDGEQHQMDELAVTFDGRSYRYREYCYDLLSDAIDYARLDHARSSYQKEPASPSHWIESEKPSEAERQIMAKLAITFDGKRYHYRDYRYDLLVDAVNYAELTRLTGAI